MIVVVAVEVGRLSMPPILEEEDRGMTGGGIDRRETDAREAEEDLGLRGEAGPSDEVRLGLGVFLVISPSGVSFGAGTGPRTWNSQGVTSSLFLVLALRPDPTPVVLDRRFWRRGWIGGETMWMGRPLPSWFKEVLEDGISGMGSGE